MELPHIGDIRTLPLRLQPRPGEALDSWLEALACRASTAWGDMLAAVGLGDTSVPVGGIASRKWLVKLEPQQLRSVSVATSVDPAVIQDMGLHRFRDKTPTDAGARKTAPLRWLHSYISRYCPVCLAETGGHWQLWWRLKWAFACPAHRCLLADACPACHRVQRHRDLPAGLIPTPGRCTRKSPSASGRNLTRCGALLGAAAVVRLSADHPAILAQHELLAASVAETTSWGIYAEAPVPIETFFADVRAVGRRASAYADAEQLHRYVQPDLIAAVRHAHALSQVATRRSDRPNTACTSAAVAAAASAALAVLGAPDIAEAGHRLHTLVAGSRGRGLSVSASNVGWGRGVSRALIGVQLRALAPFLRPTDQLRYRLSSALPTRPCASRQGSPIVRRVPALLWLPLSARFVQPHTGAVQLRSALSVAVSVVGSRLNLTQTAHLLGSVTTGPATSRILQMLHADPHWPAILTALTRLATYLQENPAPIDYGARRSLPYDDLLPDAEWTQICRATATPIGSGVKARVVRSWLYERLSSSPGSRCPSARDTAEFRTKLSDFPRSLTPELLAHLDAAGRRYLDHHGLTGEPLTWCPPTKLMNNLDLPANEPAAMDIEKVRGLLRDEQLSVFQAAQRLNSSPDALRLLVETHPMPLVFSATQRRARGAVLADCRAALTNEVLRDLYQHQRRSLNDIAKLVGASHQTISRLAREYGITPRAKRQIPSTTVTNARSP